MLSWGGGGVSFPVAKSLLVVMNINTETILEATALVVQQTLSFIKSEETLGMPEAVYQAGWAALFSSALGVSSLLWCTQSKRKEVGSHCHRLFE